MSDPYGGRLFPQHQDVLRARAVPPDVADERGYVSADGVAQLRRLGFSIGAPPLPALVIPRYTVDGERAAPQVRPDRPRVTPTGKERKYEAPVGAANFLDVHPRCRAVLADAAIPLVVSCEGTLKADALLAHLGAGYCVVSVPGVTCWRSTSSASGTKTTTALADWADVALRGRLVHLACDSDYTGNAKVRGAVTALARYLENKGAGVRVVFPAPGDGDTKQGWDDYLAAGGAWATRLAELEPNIGQHDEPARRRSQADELVDQAGAANLFHDQNGDAYARLTIGDHRELWPVRSRGFRRWLVAGYYAATGKAPNAEALGAALAVAEARAAFDGPEEEVFLRVAPDGAGGAWLDLGRDDWGAVHLTGGGWQLVAEPGMNLWRPPALGPLPVPAPGGDLDGLWDFVNVPEGDARALVRAWLVAAVWPHGPYPLLNLGGEQGSAKTTTARVLRRLVDPARPEVRRPPRSERDLGVASRHCWLLAFDNLGELSDWFSDALCVLSTGGGFATRSLYSDADEVVFDARRPVLLTGIADVVDAPDLADRTVAIVCPSIDETSRREETDLWAAFGTAAPGLLGALLTEVAGAAARLDNVTLDTRPRMADFAKLAVAAEQARGATDGFLAAYGSARHRAAVDSLESTSVGALAATMPPFEGTSTELLAVLEKLAAEGTTKRKDWPKSARALAGRIRRLAPGLRAAGRTVDFVREGHACRRLIVIGGKVAQEPQPEHGRKQPSAPSAPSDQDFCADGADGTAPVQTQTAPEPSAAEQALDLREHVSADGADGADGRAHHLSGGTPPPETCAVCGSTDVYLHRHDDGAPLCQPCVHTSTSERTRP